MNSIEIFRLPALLIFCTLIFAGLLDAQEKSKEELPTEEDYYPMVEIPTPENVVLEVGAIDWMPDGRMAVSSRRGDIYMFSNPLAKDPANIKSKLYAEGLHEVLGLAYRNDWLYVTQRGEVSRLKDTDSDGKADIFETISDEWEINGDYHEYAFGSTFDKEGNIWVVLCLTGSFTSQNKYRGWCLRVDENGKTVPTCSGIRSPGGIGLNSEGDVFYTDNQGPWNGTCGLKWLRKGSFQGNPQGNGWYKETDAMGKRPEEPKSGSRIMTEAKRIPELEPTAVLFPYRKMGQSASGIFTDMSDGKFGPFKKQMFVCDQTFSTVMRIDLEKVKGHYQGACFPFRSGFHSGSLAISMGKDGSMFVGGTNRGWGSRGKKPFALDRINWSGKVPFEVHTMRAQPDGFELTFTKPVDPKKASEAASYKLQTYTYIYQSSYGSPEVDHTEPTIESITVASDGKSLRMKIDGLQEGHVHELHLDGVRSKDGLPLLHKEAYYTLNYIPEE